MNIYGFGYSNRVDMHHYHDTIRAARYAKQGEGTTRHNFYTELRLIAKIADESGGKVWLHRPEDLDLPDE